MFQKTLVFFFGLLSLSSSYAKDGEGLSYDEIVASIENSRSSHLDTRTSFGFSSSDFDNRAYRLRGQMYSFSAQVTSPSNWLLGLDLPYLNGKNTGEYSAELGNPNIRTRFNFWQMSDDFSVWLPVSVRLGQRGPDYLLASHHDTYRGGLDLDYHKGQMSSTIGAAYHLRTLEEDKRFDIGDIYDMHTIMRYAITPTFALRGRFEWYSVQPTKIERMPMTERVDWAAVSPGASYQIMNGLTLMSEVTFPVLQTATPYETDLAFGEVYYPAASDVTWSWGLGANF